MTIFCLIGTVNREEFWRKGLDQLKKMSIHGMLSLLRVLLLGGCNRGMLECSLRVDVVILWQ